MYYLCSENKEADQLRGYREADLRLCFRPCKLLVFSRTGSYRMFGNIIKHQESSIQNCIRISFETIVGILTFISRLW